MSSTRFSLGQDLALRTRLPPFFSSFRNYHGPAWFASLPNPCVVYVPLVCPCVSAFFCPLIYFYAAIRSCIPWFFPPLLLISRDDPADGCYIVGRTFGMRNLVTSGPMRRRMVSCVTRFLGREMASYGHKAGVVLFSADFLVLATGSRTNSVSSAPALFSELNSS